MFFKFLQTSFSLVVSQNLSSPNKAYELAGGTLLHCTA